MEGKSASEKKADQGNRKAVGGQRTGEEDVRKVVVVKCASYQRAREWNNGAEFGQSASFLTGLSEPHLRFAFYSRIRSLLTYFCFSYKYLLFPFLAFLQSCGFPIPCLRGGLSRKVAVVKGRPQLGLGSGNRLFL